MTLEKGRLKITNKEPSEDLLKRLRTVDEAKAPWRTFGVPFALKCEAKKIKYN